jgi:RHS repeat-associated protein
MGWHKLDTDFCIFLEIVYSEKRHYAEKKCINYYPFGLEHKGYNSVATSTSIGQKFTFNGQQFDESLNLNVQEMTFRQYDTAIGRFYCMDRLAEFATSLTPYRFGFNNPILYSDSSGLYEIGSNGEYILTDQSEINAFIQHLSRNQHASVQELTEHIVISDDFAEQLDEVTITVGDKSSENNAKKEVATQVQKSLSRISSRKSQWDIIANDAHLHHEYGVHGFGVSFEVAFPFRFRDTDPYGLGVDFGILSDRDGSTSYLTTKATYESGFAFGAQLEAFQALKTSTISTDYIYRSNLRGQGFEVGLGIGPVGDSTGVSDAAFRSDLL